MEPLGGSLVARAHDGMPARRMPFDALPPPALPSFNAGGLAHSATVSELRAPAPMADEPENRPESAPGKAAAQLDLSEQVRAYLVPPSFATIALPLPRRDS